MRPKPRHRPASPAKWGALAASLLTLLVAPLLVATTLAAQDFSHPDSEPAPQTAQIQQANQELAAGDFTAALKTLTRLNAQTPNNAQVLYDLGLTLEALAPSTPAQAAAQAATTPTPTSTPSPPSTAAQSLTAESCYRQSIAADPHFAAPRVALGLLLARASRFAAARSELTAATTLADASPALKARAFRALARIDLTGDARHATPPNPSAATTDLLAALKLTSEEPEDILLSAQIAAASNNLPLAEQAFRRYLALPGSDSDSDSNSKAAGNPLALAGLAHVLLAQQRTADAETLLTPALAAHPSDPGLTVLLVQAYLSSGDSAKVPLAVPLLQKLHTAHPADPNITRLLAHVYLDTGHPEQADPLYAALIAADPAHPDPTLLDARGETLLRLHRPADAEPLLRQAVADPSAFPHPDDFADAATHLAFAAAENGDPTTTLRALALRAKVQPASPATLFLAAAANDRLHRNLAAIDLYRKFLAAAAGKLPDQESQARQRLTALQPRR